jgi:hypothetical protein
VIGPVTLLEGAELLDDPIIHQRRKGWAVFSPDERYRYALGRPLYTSPGFTQPKGRIVAFVMLNPSTADADQDDPTVARCVKYAHRWNASHLVVANAFAYRSTDPEQLRAAGVEPVGRDNDAVIAAIARAADLVVCAWGVHGKLRDRGKAVRQLLEAHGARPHLLRLTKHGHPQHPLYLRGDLQPVPWA